MLNNKGKKQGTGTTTEARKERFRKKGMERENKNMKLEDVNIDWAKAAADKTYGKPHLLTKQELHDYLWPKEAEEKRKEKEKLEQDCKKLKKSSKAAKDGNGASSSANLDKREASPDTKDAQAKTEPVSLDKRDPKSDGAAKQAMEKVEPKQEIKQEAPKPNKSKVQTEVEKWEERTNLDKREVPKPLVFGPSPKEKAKEVQKGSKPQTSSSSSSPASSAPDWDASSSDVSSSDHEPPAKKVKEEDSITLKEAPEYLDKRYSWQPKRPRIAVDWHHTLEIRNSLWCQQEGLGEAGGGRVWHFPMFILWARQAKGNRFPEWWGVQQLVWQNLLPQAMWQGREGPGSAQGRDQNPVWWQVGCDPRVWLVGYWVPCHCALVEGPWLGYGHLPQFWCGCEALFGWQVGGHTFPWQKGL